MTPFDVLNEVKTRSAEAVIAQSGLSHEGLRRHLRAALAGADPVAGALLQEPVLEGAHPFVTAEETMSALAGSLLHPDLVAALDGLPTDHDYRFPSSRKPFRHQAEAWRVLAEKDPQSVLVTSGTGSGKTECFLFPILSDLANQTRQQREPIEGVQAIMLYPLNALIESQRERLSAWTQPFGGKIRYCLYNGDLPRTARESDRRRSAEQVIDRERLRTSPPPVLVTNITMLEYMLVRAEDRSILDASQGKLKWIVLDEAHSLVGAAAAEIALLLRRALLAFSVEPEEVRFVATSATIGSGEDLRQQLQCFLADVAGIPDGRVHVIEGQRQMPGRPDGAPEQSAIDIRSADVNQLYKTLGRDPLVWQLVERLYAGSVPLVDFEQPAKNYGGSAADLVFAMSRAARKTAEQEQERLAPIRLHAFERAIPGLWSCVNPECDHGISDWPFGRILPERTDECPSCGAPTLEVVSCHECGEAFLEGNETGPQLSAPLRNPPRDEFAFDSIRENDTGLEESNESDLDAVQEEAEPAFVQERLFAANPTSAARNFFLDKKAGWRVVDAPVEGGVTLLSEEHNGSRACPHCSPAGRGGSELLRPLRFGAPFMLGNAAPILLEGVDPVTADARDKLPSEGRRLLSFTDSRQGTARMAAKLQIESERNFLRSFVYHHVEDSTRPPPGADDEAKILMTEIQQIEQAFASTRLPALERVLAEKRRRLATLSSGNIEGIAWPEIINRLASRIEVAEWITSVWQSRDEELFADSSKVAEFLLLREFARRPKRANSLETLGLARLRNPAIDRLTDNQLPNPLRRRGKTVEDWRAYLDTVLTWFVRANGAIALTWQIQHWVSSKAKLTSLVGPDNQTDGNNKLRAWPNGYFRAHPRSRPVALLVQGLGLALDDPNDRSDLDDCLQAAWVQVQATFSSDPERRVFDFSKTYVAPVTDGFYCPVTRRILDRAPFGLTPYGLEESAAARRRAQSVALPRHPTPMLGLSDVVATRTATREWIDTDAAIRDLRNKGAWTNISDRLALFADYLRSAEHSAQQESARLRRYEREFKAGKINILNCSTTMEMGVDIGSVSSVMMTNVPPSIANYRQRVGRAGRRGQSVALAFTFCKDRPLDRAAFHDPHTFLQRTLAAPNVTLSSRPIVQRHVNAFLLGTFMRGRDSNAMSMQIGAFFGCPADLKDERPSMHERPVQTFINWLERPTISTEYADALTKLTQRSILARDQRLVETTKDAIVEILDGFVAEWDGLRTLAKDEGLQDAGKSRMGVELKRLCGEFLLGSLADRGFLPGHGFPTDVVSFMPGKEFRSPQEPLDGGRQFRIVGPQRSLDLAIRDYAPGSEVVLDGLVHRSAGVTLNWKRPASEENLPEIQSLRHHWHCTDCGASDTQRGRSTDGCSICGAEHLTEVEFLKPAGFSVDPRDRAHADTDSLSYVPSEDPIVSARDAAWKTLPIPELGRFRCSPEGLVYYSNRGGPNGSGYALCLQCGRAEADVDNSGLAAPHPALVDHKPLRYRKGVDRCAGNEKPFSIKRNVSLGHEITTDVFELQLQHPLPRAGANALVIAFREALAQELGIEADEMGFVAVKQGRTVLGSSAVSLYLFDRTAGGGGFSTSLEFRLRPVIRRAEQILDCNTPGCIRGCAACVMTPDAPDGKDELDRTAALNFLRTHIMITDEVDANDRFSPDAELSVAPLDEIGRELRRSSGTSLILFMPDDCNVASLEDWTLTPQLLRWFMHGYPIKLAVTSAQISALSAADKLAVRDFVQQNRIDLVAAEAPLFENGARALAAVTLESGRFCVWASRDPEAQLPGPAWGRPIKHPVVRGNAPIPNQFTLIDLNSLVPHPKAHLVHIDSELNCDLSVFGDRAAKIIVQLLNKCGNWPKHGLVSASYQDPYVSSPLVVRLLIDTVAQIFLQSESQDAPLVIETRIPRNDNTRNSPWQIWHDWRDADDHAAVVKSFGQFKNLRASVLHKDVPHGRYLTFTFGDGKSASVVLDQGFGAWVPSQRPARFDFRAEISTQTKSLASMNLPLQRRGAGKTYFVATSA